MADHSEKDLPKELKKIRKTATKVLYDTRYLKTLRCAIIELVTRLKNTVPGIKVKPDKYHPASALIMTTKINPDQNYQQISELLDKSEIFFLDRGKFFEWLDYFTTSFMAYVLIRNLLPLDDLAELLGLEKPANCYLVGRLVLNVTASKGISTLICFCHVSWRFLRHMRRPRIVNLFVFISQDMNKFYTQSRLDRVLNPDLVKESDDFTYLLLRFVMCYPTKELKSTKVSYRLRSNRTQDAYNHMLEHFLCSYRCIMIFVQILFTITASIFLCVIVSDIGYTSAYQKCAPELSDDIQSGRTSSFSVSFASWHKIASVFMDSLENWVIWYESITAIFCVAPVCYLLNYDLLICWNKTEIKLNDLARRVKLEYFESEKRAQMSEINCDSNHRYERIPELERSISTDGNVEYYRRLDQQIMESNWGPYKAPNSKSKLTNQQREFEGLAFELQSEISDFFEQFEQADWLASDILFYGVFVWISTFATLTYYSVSINIRGYMIGARFCQVLGFGSFSIAMSLLWEINRRLMKAYKKLCTIAAYDRSLHKIKYIQLLKYFTERKRTSFTLMRRYPVITRTYFSILSWTISCLIVVETLFTRHRKFSEG